PVAPTYPDLQFRAAPEGGATKETHWYLRFRDKDGNRLKTKVTTEEILQRLQNRKLSTRAEAARTLQGEFHSLDHWPEFQQIVADLRAQRKSDRRKSSRKSKSTD